MKSKMNCPLKKDEAMKGVFREFVRLLFFVLMILICSTPVIGQNNNAPPGDFDPTVQVLPPSPTASALGKYGDVPVSLYTGVPDVSIPLYEVKGRGISVPIGISYHAGGIKVDDISSWVGLGWSLNAGGVISRTIRGLPDEDQYGYLNVGDQIPVPFDITDFDYLWQVGNGFYDSQPDLFTFNVAGYSGKFVFDDNGNVRTIPHSNLKITPPSSFQNGHFTLTTPEGIIYKFGGVNAVETSKTNVAGGNQPCFPYNFDIPSPTSWYLVEVFNPNTEDRILLNYTSHDIKYDFNYYEKWAFPLNYRYICSDLGNLGNICYESLYGPLYRPINPETPCQTVNFKTDYGVHLNSIVSSYETVVFESFGERNDITLISGEVNRLRKIVVNGSDGITPLRQFEFNQEFRNSDGMTPSDETSSRWRMYLEEIVEKSMDGAEEKPPYRFSYYQRDLLPPRLSFAQDHLGFYNGAEDNQYFSAHYPESLPNYNGNINGAVPDYYSQIFRGQSANRDPDADFSQYGILKSITYPTGGSSEFNFEGNELPVCDSIEIRINANENAHAIWSHPQNSGPQTIRKVITLDVAQEVKIDYLVIQIQPQGAQVSINALNPNNPFPGKTWGGAPSPLNLPNMMSGIEYLELEAGDYEIEAIVAHGPPSPPYYPYTNGEEARIAVDFTESGGMEFVRNKPAPGIRIASIITNDSMGNEQVKKYEYTSINGKCEGESSGVVVGRIPKYASYNFNTPGNWCPAPGGPIVTDPCATDLCEVLNVESSSLSQLTNLNGAHIVYEEAWEIFGENAEYGKIYQEFTYLEDLSPQVGFSKATIYDLILEGAFFIAPRTDRSWAGGLVKNRKTFDKNGSVVHELINNYEISNSSIINQSILGITVRKLYELPCSPTPGSQLPDRLDEYVMFYYKTLSNWQYLKSSTEIIDGVSTTTNYEYDNPDHLNVTTTEMVNSDGKTHLSEIQYAHEVGNQEMIDRHMIGIPLKKERRVDGSIVGGEETTYDNFGNLLLPEEFYEILEGGAKLLKGTIHDYDDHGNILSFSKRGFAIQNFQWSDDDLLNSRSFLNFNWEYEYYDNSRLLKSITDIKGLKSSYQYDGFQRLSYADARNGGLRSTYKYLYTLANGGDPNVVEVFTSEDNVTRKNRIDGLGRPLQTTSCGYGPGKEDVVHGAVSYDAFGRVERQYQPHDGECGRYTSPGGPYDRFEYEFSPLSRELKRVFADGSNVQTQYASNDVSDMVTNFQSSTPYAAGELYKVTVYDEIGHPTITFKDKIGRVILIRKKWEGNNVDTYYQYDDRDNLIAVMPPGTSSPTNPDIAYQYEYDERNRIKSKKLPGAGIQTFGYNDRDEVTSSTDGNGNIVSYEYDGHGRDTLTLLQKPLTNQEVPIIYKKYDGGGGGSMGELIREDKGILNGNGGRSVGTAYQYDQYGRVRIQRDRAYRGGVDTYNYSYDGAKDRVERIGRHYGPFAWTETYRYDHVGREIQQIHKMTRGSVYENDAVYNHRLSGYDIKDQLISKSLDGLQTIGYGYDLRGRLTRINKLPLVYDPDLSPVGPCGGGGGGGGSSDSLACGDIEVDLESLLSLIGSGTTMNVDCYDGGCPPESPPPGSSCEYSISTSGTLLRTIQDEGGTPIIVYDPPLDLTASGATDALANRIRDFLDTYGYTYDLVDVNYSNGTVNIFIGETNFAFGFIDFGQESVIPFTVDCEVNTSFPTGTSGQIAAQQSSLQTLSSMMANTTVNTINYPTTLYQLNLYQGKRALLLEEEVSYLKGEGVYVGCTDIDSSNQEIPVIEDGKLVNKSLTQVLLSRQNNFSPDGDEMPKDEGGCDGGIPLCQFVEQYNAHGVLASSHVRDSLSPPLPLPDTDLSGSFGLEYSLHEDAVFWTSPRQGELAWDISFNGNDADLMVTHFSISVTGHKSTNHINYLGIYDGNHFVPFNGGQYFIDLSFENPIALEVDNPEQLTSYQLENLQLAFYCGINGVKIDGVKVDIEYEAPCEPCSPNGPACTETERQLQEASIIQLNNSIQSTQANQLVLPTMLQRLRFCDGTIRYVLETELSLISGSYAVLQDVEITALDQQFHVFADGLPLDVDVSHLLDLRRNANDLLIDDYGCPVRVAFSEGPECQYNLYQENWEYANVTNSNLVEVSYDEVIKKTCAGGIEEELSRKTTTTIVDIFKDYEVHTDIPHLHHGLGHLGTLNLLTKNPDDSLLIDFNPSSVLYTYPGLANELNPGDLLADTLNVEKMNQALNTVLAHAIAVWGQSNRSVAIADYYVSTGTDTYGDGKKRVLVKIAFRVYHITNQAYVSISPSTTILNYFDGYNNHQSLPFTASGSSRIDASSREVPCGFVSASYDDEIVDQSTTDWYQLPLNSPNPVRSLENSCSFSATAQAVSDCDSPKRTWNGEEFVDCESCEPEPPNCTPEEQTAQQQFRDSMQVVLQGIDPNAINYPDSLLRILFCDGTEMYIFSSQASALPGGGTVVQTIPVNSPGQTFGIEAPSDTTDLFAMKLTYEPNGNVKKVRWQVKYAPEQQYDFLYDDLDRMEHATYSGQGYLSNASYNEDLIYKDARGNIEKLTRSGYNDNCSYSLIDDLIYTYDQGNKVIHIDDLSNNERGFKERLGGGSEHYRYDANGNMVYDWHKGIDSIEYNYLNLPGSIIFGGSPMTYTYDAGGKKHKGPGPRDYVNNLEYYNGLEAIYTDEGRVVPILDPIEGLIDSFQYEYTIRDHLGNSRIYFSDLNEDLGISIPGVQEVLQERHYYPFGLQMEGPFLSQVGPNNRYQYNGKEWNPEGGLNWFDYGARLQDPATARWWVQDPLQEQMYSWAPYNYVLNNPIKFIDPDGRKFVNPYAQARDDAEAASKEADEEHERVKNDENSTKKDIRKAGRAAKRAKRNYNYYNELATTVDNLLNTFQNVMGESEFNFFNNLQTSSGDDININIYLGNTIGNSSKGPAGEAAATTFVPRQSGTGDIFFFIPKSIYPGAIGDVNRSKNELGFKIVLFAKNGSTLANELGNVKYPILKPQGAYQSRKQGNKAGSDDYYRNPAEQFSEQYEARYRANHKAYQKRLKKQ